MSEISYSKTNYLSDFFEPGDICVVVAKQTTMCVENTKPTRYIVNVGETITLHRGNHLIYLGCKTIENGHNVSLFGYFLFGNKIVFDGFMQDETFSYENNLETVFKDLFSCRINKVVT